MTAPDGPLHLLDLAVEPAWIDYNGHMNMGYYLVAYDRATDGVATSGVMPNDSTRSCTEQTSRNRALFRVGSTACASGEQRGKSKHGNDDEVCSQFRT